MSAIDDQPALRRETGLLQLTLFGLGSMLGAGIYGLIGVAAGVMGSAVWVAFLIAMVAALLTGVSYASIASRYPRAAGAAYAARRAYPNPAVSYVVGLAVVCSGLTSIATQSRVVAANLKALLDMQGVPTLLLAFGFLLLVGGLVFRGLKESLWFNAVCTVVEASGLLLVIAVGLKFWGRADLLELPPDSLDGGAVSIAALSMQGAVLTFFSFIGFEDMLNVSEEVKRPERTMPMGLLLAMGAATLIYLAVSVTAVSVVHWKELAAAPGPLVLVVERAAPWFPPGVFAVVTVFAVANTALVNYVMGSRLLYGMARQGLLPARLGAVHRTRRTPHMAVLLIGGMIAVLLTIGDIGDLAASTVLLLLTVFAIVNVGLIILLRREGPTPGRFNAPIAVPALGAVVCVSLIVARVLQGGGKAPLIAGGLFVGILILYAVTRRSRAARLTDMADDEATDAQA